MSAKYAKGQKVKIIYVKNQHLKSKYPELERYVSETGVVVDSNWIGMRNLQRPAPRLDVKDYYFYTIRLDKDGSKVKAVPEDALEAID